MNQTTDHRALLHQLRRRLVRSGTLARRLRGWEGVIEIAGHSGACMMHARQGALAIPMVVSAEPATLRVFGDPIVLQAVLNGHLSVDAARISRQLEVDGEPGAVAALERLVAPELRVGERSGIGSLMACATLL